MNSHPSLLARLSRHRGKVVILAILALLAIRAWPVIASLGGWNLAAAEDSALPDASFLPPGSVPSEIRSGRPRLGHGAGAVAGTLFLPRVVRHGHVFKRDDPALSSEIAGRLAVVLADPATYEAWSGHKMCGGFHADWYLRWESGPELILCEGCQEVVLYREGRALRCDLSQTGYQRITAILGNGEGS